MDQVKTYQELINDKLSTFFHNESPDTLYEPIRYIMDLGGKRIRPLLTLMAYNLYKEDVDPAIRPALGVELFHNFTLMHDDIMDQAPLRRGQDTIHIKWNLNQAILSGDSIFIRAFEFFLDLKPEFQNRVLKNFLECASAVCEGQQMDMDFENSANISTDQYLDMIGKKTAALLGFSLELGGMLAQAPEQEIKALKEFGINIGMGFQLKDDMLDLYADQEKFGKQTGGDIVVNKKTFLLIKAMELANPSQKKILDHWISKKDFVTHEKVLTVKGIFDELEIHSLTEELMNHYFEQAFSRLDQIRGRDESLAMLKNYTERLVNREH